MEIVLARHGESLGNIVDYDCPDPELTEQGLRQARLLAKRLENEHFDHILCSPLVRALETAWIVCSNRETKPEVHFHLREVRGLDKHTGIPGKVLKERFPGIRLMDEILDSDQGWVDPGNETRETGYIRAKYMVEYIKDRFQESDRILIVAHGTFNGLFISALLGLDPASGIRFAQHNTCLNGFRIENDQCKVLYINDHSHLKSDANS